MSIDEGYMAFKAAQAAQNGDDAESEEAEKVERPEPKSITGRFEFYVPLGSGAEIENIVREIEGIDEVYKMEATEISNPGHYTIYRFDVEDAYELGPQVQSAAQRISEALGIDDIYVVWHAVTGVRW